MEKFDTTTPVLVVLSIPAGRVQFIAADHADTTVDVRPANAFKSRDVKAAERVEATYGDGVLHVTAPEAKNQLFGPSGAVEVTIQLPAGSRVQAKTASTELRVVGRLGDLSFEGAYRQIKIDEVANVRLTAVDGDVEIGRLNGSGHISTARGDIRIAEAGRGTLDLRTNSGDITVAAASGVSASLNADTPHGRIDNALKNNGVTELTIQATTSNGHITARSR